VRTPGHLTFAVVRELVSEFEVVGRKVGLHRAAGALPGRRHRGEPAGALAIAALDSLADTIAGRSVVCVLSGGNNDVARYGEIIERSLVTRASSTTFSVAFPQQPGALRRFLDKCLGPSDDIVLFEYVKKNDREFGPAVVGVELAQRQISTASSPVSPPRPRTPSDCPRQPVFRLLV